MRLQLKIHFTIQILKSLIIYEQVSCMYYPEINKAFCKKLNSDCGFLKFIFIHTLLNLYGIRATLLNSIVRPIGMLGKSLCFYNLL